jgi:hypothetical protein
MMALETLGGAALQESSSGWRVEARGANRLFHADDVDAAANAAALTAERHTGKSAGRGAVRSRALPAHDARGSGAAVRSLSVDYLEYVR